MDQLPEIGDQVRFDDPWFYPGQGVVVGVQTQPHHAVEVLVGQMDDEVHRKNWDGKKVWLLPGHLTPL